jgi:outer membrane immunogenic protein
MIGAKSRVSDGSVAMRRLLLAVMMSGATVGAQAADMPDFLRGSLPAGPEVTANWQGYYIGGQASYGSVNSILNAWINADLQTTYVAPPPFSYNWQGLDQAHSGNVGYGAFFGYNSQWDCVVIGLEGNYIHNGFHSLTTSTGYTYNPDFSIASAATSSALIGLTDFGSVRLRGGYAVGSFLPYVFAGAGMGSQTVNRSISASPAPLGPPDFQPLSNIITTNIVYGYSAGAGFDFMFWGGFFLRAEYEFQRIAATVDSRINSVHVGLGYKF